MSGTLLEQTRADHEEVERLERLVVKDLQRDVNKTHKERLHQNHRVRNMVDAIMTATSRLIDVYEDKDHARQDEIALLGGQSATGQNVFSVFYDRLKEIREYHRRHPNARVIDAGEDPEELLKEEPWVDFSGESVLSKPGLQSVTEKQMLDLMSLKGAKFELQQVRFGRIIVELASFALHALELET